MFCKEPVKLLHWTLNSQAHLALPRFARPQDSIVVAHVASDYSTTTDMDKCFKEYKEILDSKKVCAPGWASSHVYCAVRVCFECMEVVEAYVLQV